MDERWWEASRGRRRPLNLQGTPSTEMEVVRGTSPFRLELELKLKL